MTKRLDQPAGGVLMDGVLVAETLQCAHCGMHWERIPGSGRLRGWCRKCDAVLCGQAACMSECKPFEKWLEEQERV